jgi:hypothetical protein
MEDYRKGTNIMSQEQNKPASFAEQVEQELLAQPEEPTTDLTPITEKDADIVVRVSDDQSDEAGAQQLAEGLSEYEANADQYPDDAAIQDATDNYVEHIEAIKSKPDFTTFKAGYMRCLEDLKEKIDEMDDEDLAAIYFDKGSSQQAAIREQIGDVKEWVEEQDAAEPDIKVAEWQGTDLEAIDAAEKGGLPMPAIGRDTQVAGASIEDLRIEKVLREQQEYIERLEQESIRNNEAVQLWAATSDFFNIKLAGTPESDMNIPLLDRIQAYVTRLEDYDGELPPSLAGFLTGQPEADQPLNPVHQLALYIQRLQDTAQAAKDQSAAAE